MIGLDIEETDGWILKIDSGGNILWSKNYGSNDSEGFTGGIVTSTNELLAYGDASDIPVDIGFHHGQGDKWVVKTNDQGEILWQGLYGGSNPEGLTYDIIKESTFNDGYYIGSVSKSSDGDVGNHHGSPNEWDYWIFKLDDTGQVIWSVALGGSNGDNLYGLSASNEIYLIGRTESNDGEVINLTDTASVWILNLSDYNNIQNFSSSSQIYIYPNPFHDRATLELSEIIGNILLKISSVDGRFVQQFEINCRRNILKINAPPGIYIYTIHDKNNIMVFGGDLIIY
ncbi:MAG TPA: T9SS type A sorting domain-containing protein [Saprospiraceae bacterium]|nr:T9SS type A sorting domain-containing protein [Saprospiraceae bacterium]